MEPTTLRDAVEAWLSYQKHPNCDACKVKLLYEMEPNDDPENTNGRLRRKGQMHGANFEAVVYIYGKFMILYPSPLELNSPKWKWNKDRYGHRVDAHAKDFFAVLLEHLQYREDDYKVRYGIRNAPRPNWLVRAANLLR